MIFTSSLFLLIVIFLLILNPLYKNVRFRQILFLLTSYLFYFLFDLGFFWLLIVISLNSYLFGLIINRVKLRLAFTIIGVAIISAFIIFFKLQLYLNFTNSADKILLPLGLSFYSFQAISYLVDVYRKKLASEKNLIPFLLYVSFFPQLVSGPIERASDLIPQIKRLPFPSKDQFVLGAKQILYGYFLKMVVSNNLNDVTFLLLNESIDYNNYSIIVGLVLFYFQIYFDFHGYTNIAIGLANIFGIKLHQNFRLPFIAKSMKDFWHRWHISLSTWFRDYLYIPLGGKKSKYKRLVILIVFMISGIWHGPTYNFLLWGIFHGVIYLIEDEINPYIKINKLLSTIIVFSLVSFGWIFFYYDDINVIESVISNLVYSPWQNSIQHLNKIILNNFIILLFLILAILLNIFENNFLNEKYKKINYLLNYFIIDVLIILIILFGFLGGKEFIYFRF